jgi:U3 small nucleolar RNA-associated protein 25
MQKHNEKLRKSKEKEKLDKAISATIAKQTPRKKKVDANGNAKSEEDVSDLIAAREVLVDEDEDGAGEGEANIQDQGYTRPRILILCPFRSSARRIVEGMISFMGKNTSVTGHEKFMDEFGNPDGDDEESGASDDGSTSASRLNDGASIATRGGADGNRKKPRDWRALFNDNIDDDFKMGIQVTPGQGKGSGVAKGVNLKLFSDFFLSDIIIASPLGLRLVVNAKENLTFDFLSSLEVVLLHQTDVMYMQNWDHVDFIASKLNCTPKTNHDTDFMRVRPYFLEGRASMHRQFIMTSNFNEPMIWNMFRERAQSVIGHIRLKKSWGDVGCLGAVATRVRQIFHLVPCPRAVDDEDVRFDFFKKNILAPMLRLDQKRTLIITPSYLSYVRLRNELMKQEVIYMICFAFMHEFDILNCPRQALYMYPSTQERVKFREAGADSFTEIRT